MFAQDWGGLIGLRVAAEDPHRFERIAIGNTGLPVGESIGPGFDRWLNMSQTTEFMDSGALLQIATLARELTDAEMDAYRAPFPSEEFGEWAVVEHERQEPRADVEEPEGGEELEEDRHRAGREAPEPSLVSCKRRLT